MSKDNFSQLLSVLTSEQKKNALKLIVFISIGMLLEAVGVGIFVPIIAVISNDNIGQSYPFILPVLEKLGNPTHQQLCIYGVGFLVFVYAIKLMFIRFVIKQEAIYVFGLSENLAKRLFSIYMHQPYSFHLQRNSAELIRNITAEVNLLVYKVISPIIKVISESFLLISISLFLFFIEPVGATSILIALGAVGWFFHKATKKRLTKWGTKRQYHEGQIFLHLQQGLGGIKDASLSGREKHFVQHFSEHNISRIDIGINENINQQTPRLWLELFAVLGLSLIVCGLIIQGKPLGTIVPTLGVFAAAAFKLLPSVNRLIVSVQSIRFGVPAIHTLCDEFKLSVDHKQELKEAGLFKETIAIKNLVYVYPASSAEALKGISLTITSGESIGIIGESGSGKSTLIDVILGLLKPQSGTIEVDGEDIQKNLRNWQNQIGYVPQSIFLTDDTLKRNIAFGLSDSEISDEAVWEAIKSAQLESFINELPESLQTIVGERGVRLSGGQRQRIGIARALYHNPSVLVLDEATSALDTATESEVMKSVYKLSGNKTIIIVAHRLSTVTACNKIYKFGKGQILHEELRDIHIKEPIQSAVDLASRNK